MDGKSITTLQGIIFVSLLLPEPGGGQGLPLLSRRILRGEHCALPVLLPVLQRAGILFILSFSSRGLLWESDIHKNTSFPHLHIWAPGITGCAGGKII